MIIELGKLSIDIPIWIAIFSSLILAFGITGTVIPSIIEISNAKRLFDKPDSRKSHTFEIPTLGGVAVFLGLIVSTMLLGGTGFDSELKYITVALLILLYLGIKDDLIEMSAVKKLLVEILAIAVVLAIGDIRVTNFHNFMHIKELPYLISLGFTLFLFIVIINGFNLIDGIDGLSAGVGILSATSLGLWFLMIGDISYSILSFSTTGALLAFFIFNLYGKKNKIFLGDTGSLIIGMVISILIVKFFEGSLTQTLFSINESAPSIAIGILIIPLMDTLRVFTLRVLVGKSPFKADRFHTHHKFLLLGFSHKKTTFIMLAFNLAMIVLSVSLRNLGNIKVLWIIIPSALFLTAIPGLIFRHKVRQFLVRFNIMGGLSWVLPNTFSNLIISHFPNIKYLRSAYIDSPDNKEDQANTDMDKTLRDAFLKYEGKENM